MRELKERLQSNFQLVSEVILFGSRATGKAYEFSDYDILVIVSHPVT